MRAQIFDDIDHTWNLIARCLFFFFVYNIYVGDFNRWTICNPYEFNLCIAKIFEADKVFCTVN